MYMNNNIPDFSENLFGGLHTISNEELEDKVSQHKIWLRTSGHEGQKLELFRYDLSNKIFDKKDLSKASFQLCDFRNTKIFNCNLNKANFHGACLDTSICENSQFEECSFISSVVRQACFESCSFKKSIFMYATWDESHFKKCNLHQGDFERCNLTKTRFSHSIIDGAFLPIFSLDVHLFKNCTASEKTKFLGNCESKETNGNRVLVWKKGKFDAHLTAIKNGQEQETQTLAPMIGKWALGAWTSARCELWQTLSQAKQMKLYEWIEEEKTKHVPHATELPLEL